MPGFDDAAALAPAGPGRWTAQVPEDWSQGRTAFGGLVAAMAAGAAGQLAGPERPLRSLDIAFIAPLPPGRVQLSAQVLSQGRAVTQLEVDLRTTEGVLSCRVHVVAGAARTSSIVVPAAAPVSADAHAAPEESGVEFPFLPGVTPTFTQHVAIRWCGEAFPFTAAGPEGAVIRAWVRHRTAATGLGAVIALLDACPPTILPAASGPAPVSSVRWSAQLVEPVPDEAAGGWFWYEGETVHAQDGYALEQTRLFLAGRLVGWSEQLVTLYDRPDRS